jgi:hypothetical protein
VAESYRQLNDEGRHVFAALSLRLTSEGEVLKEGLAELQSRADDIDSGRVRFVDGEDFLCRLRVT